MVSPEKPVPAIVNDEAVRFDHVSLQYNNAGAESLTDIDFTALRGQTIGVNDLHIAAHARSEGLTLVSNNLREFERVEALQLANWAI